MLSYFSNFWTNFGFKKLSPEGLANVFVGLAGEPNSIVLKIDFKEKI